MIFRYVHKKIYPCHITYEQYIYIYRTCKIKSLKEFLMNEPSMTINSQALTIGAC